MNRNLILLLMTLLALSCQPSQTQGEAADESGTDSPAVTGSNASAPGMLPGQIVDRQLIIAPADFQPQSAARELAQVLAGSTPAGKSVKLNYMTFEPGAVIFQEQGAAAREVDELAVILREHPSLFVDVAVYAGDAESGQRLAVQRAFFIKNRLIEDMVEPERIDTKGFSADGGGERVEVRVIR